jgi:hypothetical protein
MAKVTTLYSKADPVAIAVVSTRNIDTASNHLKDVAAILIREGRFEELAELHEMINNLVAAYSIEDQPIT